MTAWPGLIAPAPSLTLTPTEWSNWASIIEANCRKWGVRRQNMIGRTHRTKRDIAALQETAYTLAAVGRRAGRSLTPTDVGRMLDRHRASVLQAAEAHRRRHDLPVIAGWEYSR